MKISNFLDYSLAGKANFQIKISGIVSHYQVTKKAGSVWFIYGSDNGSDWRYLGCIKNNYFNTNKSEFTFDSKVLKAFNFVFELAKIKKDDDRVEIWHNGKCSKCGRELIDQLSVELGVGPKCRQI